MRLKEQIAAVPAGTQTEAEALAVVRRYLSDKSVVAALKRTRQGDKSGSGDCGMFNLTITEFMAATGSAEIQHRIKALEVEGIGALILAASREGHSRALKVFTV